MTDSIESKEEKERIVHKTCPTWGETQCHKTLFPVRHDAPKTSYRWVNVTCKRCLKAKP